MPARFRDLVPDWASPQLVAARGQSAHAFGEVVRTIPGPKSMIEGWGERIAQPFQGVTCDGRCEHGLYGLADEGAPTAAMARAAQDLLRLLDPAQRAKLCYDIDAPQWRMWSNPEFLVNDNGLRLEAVSEPLRVAILAVLEASLSSAGLKKSRDCMRVNAFLGSLVDLPLVMNEWSYNFSLFGEPGEDAPWGWSLFGHHLCLNCFVLGQQMVITPTFMGAEPNEIDVGPYAGTKLFQMEEAGGLALMRSLAPALRERATVYRQMVDPAMPPGRWVHGDERALGGAFQDNRVVPLEGVPASEFNADQRNKILEVASAFLEYLPAGPLSARLRQIEEHMDRTWWSWIGGHGDDDPFYYRVQSPVVMLEFDHHSGIWLANEQPAKCHIHTVVRTPNGNDYGRDLLRQHYREVHPGRSPGEMRHG